MPPYDSLPDISPFHEIEVWCTFTRRWVPGFWLEGLEPDGSIRLRRGIDQAPLSGPVPASSVRTRQSNPGRVIDLRSTGRVDTSDRNANRAANGPATGPTDAADDVRIDLAATAEDVTDHEATRGSRA